MLTSGFRASDLFSIDILELKKDSIVFTGLSKQKNNEIDREEHERIIIYFTP